MDNRRQENNFEDPKEEASHDRAMRRSSDSPEFPYEPTSQTQNEEPSDRIFSSPSDVENSPSFDYDDGDDLIIQENSNRCSRLFRSWNRLSLVKRTIIMCVIGFTLGLIIQFQDPSDDVIEIVGFPGRLFIRVLKLLVMPMIGTSMALAPNKLGDAAQAKMIGKKVLIYYLSTTFLAAAEGLVVVNMFRPGEGTSMNCKVSNEEDETFSDVQDNDSDVVSSILQIGDSVLPENIVEAWLNYNILGLITFSLWFGFILMTRGSHDQPDPLVAIINSAYEILMSMIMTVIDFTPLGVFSLIAGEVSKMKDTWCAMESLGMFVVTVFVGLMIHALIVYPLLYFAFLRKNPYRYYKGVTQAVMTAFATSSSAATLPVTMQCATENNGISPETASFVFPLGATVNMDGTAIYYPVAAIFVASMTGHHLTVGRQIIIAIISAFVSIGSAPVPSAGLVYLIVILEAVGVEVSSEISFILAIDWLIDRVQTAVNICGDSIGAAIIDHNIQKHLKKREKSVALESLEISKKYGSLELDTQNAGEFEEGKTI